MHLCAARRSFGTALEWWCFRPSSGQALRRNTLKKKLPRPRERHGNGLQHTAGTRACSLFELARWLGARLVQYFANRYYNVLSVMGEEIGRMTCSEIDR